MSARDAIVYLQSSGLVPNVPLPTVTAGDANKVLAVNNTATGYVLSAGVPVDAGVNSIAAGDNSVVIDPAQGTGDVSISVSANLTLESLQVGDLVYPTAVAPNGYFMGMNNDALGFQPISTGANINYTGGILNLDTVITDILSISTQALTITGEYSLPTAIGTNGQVLGVEQGELAFIDQTGGGGTVNSIQGSTNISVNATDPASPVVSLTDNIQVIGLSVSGTAIPVVSAGLNQVLKCTSVAPVVLGWGDETGGGVVDSIQGSTNIIINSTDPAIPVVALADDVAVAGTLTVSGTAIPVTNAGLNQVLTCTGVSPVTLGWGNPSAGGGISAVGVVDALENLTVQTADQVVTLTMSQQPTFNGMTLTADLDMSNLDINGVKDITAVNIIGNTLRITTLDDPNPSISALFPPLTTAPGDSGKVLTMQTNGNPEGTTLVWAPVGGGGAVESVTAGSANLTATPTTGQVIINLSDTIDVTNVNAKNFAIYSPDSQTSISLPIIADGSPTPAFGTIITSGGDGTSSFSSSVHVDSVSTQGLELRSVDGLVTCTFPAITNPPENGNVLAADSQGNLEFTNALNVASVTTQGLSLQSLNGQVTCAFPTISTQPTDGYVLAANSLGNLAFVPPGGGGGGIVESIQGSTNISVDATDPANPIISLNPNPEVNSLILKGTTPTDDCAFPVVTSQVPVYSTFTTNGSGNLQFTTAPTFTALNFAAPEATLITSGTLTQFLANAGSGGQVVQFLGPGNAPAISLDSTAGIIKTATYPVSGGISSGNHIQTTDVIVQSLFVSAKESTGGVYSYKFPEIIGTTGIPVNSIMAMQSTPDSNFSQNIAFTTVNTLFSNSGDVTADAPSGNQVALSLKTNNSKAANYVLAVNSDGLTLEWVLNANTSSTTTYALINNFGSDTFINMYLTAYARGDGFRCMQVAGAFPTTDESCPIITKTDTISASIQLPFYLGVGNSCLQYVSGTNVLPADFISTYSVPALRQTVPIQGQANGSLSAFITLGRLPFSYSVGGVLTPQEGYCEVVLESGALDISFIKNPGTGYGTTFNIPVGKYVQFSLPGYTQNYPMTFNATFFAI